MFPISPNVFPTMFPTDPQFHHNQFMYPPMFFLPCFPMTLSFIETRLCRMSILVIVIVTILEPFWIIICYFIIVFFLVTLVYLYLVMCFSSCLPFYVCDHSSQCVAMRSPSVKVCPTLIRCFNGYFIFIVDLNVFLIMILKCALKYIFFKLNEIK